MAEDESELPKLTPKQMNFVLGKQKGLNNADAYRQASDTSKQSKETIWADAGKMVAHPKVRLWLTYISSEHVKHDITEAKYTKQRFLDDLAEVAKTCKDNEAWGPYFKATEALGKAMGHMISLSESKITREADTNLLDNIERELGPEARKRAEHKMGLH